VQRLPPFTVTVCTLYERSHVPLNKWLAATHLMSKKTAWFLCHRIRESLRKTKLDTPLGRKNKVVEADETWVGGKEANSKRRRDGARGPIGKEPVVALVERHGHVRSHTCRT